MFLLISFVLANNYCVGNSFADCKNKCQSLADSFTHIYDSIPTDEELNTSDDAIHNIYITSDVTYLDTNHTLIFCDSSIILTYNNPEKIKIKDHIYADSKKMPDDVSMRFSFSSYDQYLTIEVETDEDSNIKPFTLEKLYSSLYITTRFYTEYVPENLITLSKINANSYYYPVYEITNNVKKLFSNPDDFQENSFTYYCLSDKENKCENYADYNPTPINYTSQVNRFPCFLIVESTKPQVLIVDPDYYSFSSKQYVHIIAMPGTDITYLPKYEVKKEYDFYVILHPDSIEMYDMVFEGEGKFTLSVNVNISMVATSKINNNHFTLKTRGVFDKSISYITALRDDLSFDFENKIQVSEYSLFYGPKCLSGLFESGKFLQDDEFVVYNVTAETLKETDFDYVTYYFKEGDHEIPKTWKTSCRFQGINPNETNFIFSDVYSYDGSRIDNFIDVNFKPSSNLNRITIKPARYFYLSSFDDIYHPKCIEKYTIVVENDFIMYGSGPISSYDDDEISTEQCRIIGNGTIRFPSTYFMDQVKKFCQIDENVTLEPLNENMPSVYICLGQSNSEECKSEIDGFESLQNYEWVWLRNINTRYHLHSYHNPIYVAGRQLLFDNLDYNLVLTPKSDVTISYYNYKISDNLHIYKNGIRSITPQSKSAKLTVLHSSSDRPGFNSKPSFRVYYEEAPTEIDLQIYFHYEIVKLYMIYYKNYEEHSISLTGKCLIYIREPYQPIMNIFKCPNTIDFFINLYTDYQQICLSDEPIELSSLFDFVLCSNSEEFKRYDSISVDYSPDAYIYLDISLDFNSSYYRCKYFYLNNKNITVSVDLPNDALLIFDSILFEIVCDSRYRLYYGNSEIMFYFDIKDNITLDCITVPENVPTVEFTSSLDSVEIFPSPTIRRLLHYCTITVPENYTIYSPVPKYLNGLFENTPVHYSLNWTYYHLSEEGKLLYGSDPSILFDDFEEDDDLPENIVLAVGKDDSITIPLNWTNVHNFYIFQEINDALLINKPLNLTYNLKGIVLNHQFNIVVGRLNITVPEVFTVNSYIPYNYIRHYFYSSDLYCSKDSKTTLYTGSMYSSGIEGDGYSLVSIYGYGITNDLTIISKSADEQSYLKDIMWVYSDYNVKYRFDYDSICYCTDYDYNSKCSGKYFRVRDVTTLLTATQDYPELTVWVFNDLYIPHPTGDHFVLDPKDEDVTITVPDYPDSMMTTENETLQFNYSDSTLIEIINKSNVDVALQDYLSIYIESNTNSSITFYLDSDVFTSIESKIDANFSISVETNSYSFYIEDMNAYENIFNGTLKSYIRVCAYDIDAASPCTYSRNETIDDVFRVPFLYNVVEIALSSKPHEIRLPPISKPINVNILPVPSSSLILFTAEHVRITPDSVIVNEFWTFEGDRKVLNIKLDTSSTLSVNEEMTAPIVLQLTDQKSFIDLRDFDEQNSSLITIVKTGDELNEITVFGRDEIYENFIKSIKEHENITIVHNGTQKYLCICNTNEVCKSCKEGIDGIITTANYVLNSDPGEDVKIRVFSDYEIKSNVFNNEHEVFINSNCSLNLTYVNTVNQNIEEGLLVDNLHFVNGSNLLLKPRDIDLNIVMKEEEKGPYFTIEMDTFLRLNVTNADNENINSSRLHVNGFGELNSYDYPFDRIRPVRTVKVFKGVYIICNTRAGKDVCSYESAHRYKRLGHHDFFRPEFDSNTKILVFLDSYTSDIRVSTCILSNQRIQFIRSPSNSRRLLEGQNRLLFESNSEILNSENSTELFGGEGNTTLDNADSDLFVVCFNESIKIRQEGNISSNTKPITIQPVSNQATIILDDSVDIEKQKLKIESEQDQPVEITLLTNKNVTTEEMDKFLELDKEKISISLGGPIPTPKPKSKNGLPIGAIVGIVIGAVVAVSAIVLIVIFVIKNKKKEDTALSQDNMELSDSTF